MEDKMFLKTVVYAGMFAPSVSILLEFPKRVQKKNFPRNVGRIGGSPVDMARIFLFPINYLGLGHYLSFASCNFLNALLALDSSCCF